MDKVLIIKRERDRDKPESRLFGPLRDRESRLTLLICHWSKSITADNDSFPLCFQNGSFLLTKLRMLWCEYLGRVVFIVVWWVIGGYLIRWRGRWCRWWGRCWQIDRWRIGCQGRKWRRKWWSRGLQKRHRRGPGTHRVWGLWMGVGRGTHPAQQKQTFNCVSVGRHIRLDLHIGQQRDVTN